MPVFISAARYFSFGSQNPRSGVLKNFQAAEEIYGKRNYIFSMGIYVDINVLLTFSLFSLVLEKRAIKRAQIQSN